MATATQSDGPDDDHSEVMDDRSEVMDDRSEVMDDRSEVMDDRSEVVMDDRSEVVKDDRSEVVDDRSEVVKDDHSEVINDHSDIDDDGHGDAAAADQHSVDDGHGDAAADQHSVQNGDRLASPVEPTAYSLFTNPPDLAKMRQRLFAVSESVEMSAADFEQYFPFVDNVWRRTKLGIDELAPGSNTELYWCRLRKAPGLKAQLPKPTPEGKTRRRKREKPDKTCNMAIKVVRTDGPDNRVVISRTVSAHEEHSHDLGYIDSIKRNGAIMDVARREAVRSFLPLSIFWKMQQEPDKMEEAGGKFMKVSDVRNVQYAWRQENPTAPLKSHTGFNPQRAGFVGRGPGRKPSPQQWTDSPAATPAQLAQPQMLQQQPAWNARALATPQPKQPLLQPSTTQPPLQPSTTQAPLQPSTTQAPLQPSTTQPPLQPAATQPSPLQPPYQPPPPPPYQSRPPPFSPPLGPPPPPTASTLQYPEHARTFLAPYLPDVRAVQARQRPHVTLTYACSLDGRIAILPQQRTPLSGPESKSMTHYLRSTHSAILVGVRTALADNPALNCRLAGAAGYGAPPHSGVMQPRPIIIDPHARLPIHPKMEMLRAVCDGRALGPWVIVSPSAQLHPTAVATLKAHRGEYLQIHDYNPNTGGFSWDGIFNVLYREGIQSVMIEGGAYILSGLLRPGYAHLIDSVITTIAPQYLGQQGLQVSQPTCLDEQGRIVPTRLKDVRWQPIGDADVVIHLVHEVTSPQAFEGLEKAGRKVRRPDCTLVTTDHNVPTTPRKNFTTVADFVKEKDSRLQCVTLEENVKKFGLTYFGLGDQNQGIVHVIGPEQGFTLPGTTVVCGDSHTSTHGAFGALAFGIGTSEVEHVLATQCLITKRSKNMRIQVDGKLAPGVSSKDIILHVIGLIGTAGGTGAVIEFCGSAIRSLSMEARMSICNMSIEAGARAGMIAPDQITFDYLKGRPLAPKVDSTEWKKAVNYWTSLRSDQGASYDVDVFVDAKDIAPTVTWGTSPQDVVPVTGVVPSPDDFKDANKKASCKRALEYMGLTPGTRMEDIELDKIFIGSCTNSRIEDLRVASRIVEGKHIAKSLKRALVVPGSGNVKKQAEREGLDKIFLNAGFEWREAGCSMCLGMNPDILAPRERCASTSNRNFEGRQGALGRTHLMSPAMAAAASLTGKITDVRKLAAFTPAQKSSPQLDVQPEIAEVDTEEELDAVLDSAAKETPGRASSSALATAASGFPKFTVLKGIAAPLDKANVDTDAIIPKQFLKTIKRTGLGSALFHPLRYNEDGSPNPDFILNQEPYTNSKILVVTGPNFGCGSSREHAPWALLDFGIKCIIAPSYADIFFNNTFKNGMLPIAIADQSALDKIADEAKAGRELSVDLPNQTISTADGTELARFDVEEFRKHCLVNGLDDIGLTMQLEEQIYKFEAKRSLDTPWLDGSGYLKKWRKGPVKLEAAPVPKTNRGEVKTDPVEWSYSRGRTGPPASTTSHRPSASPSPQAHTITTTTAFAMSGATSALGATVHTHESLAASLVDVGIFKDTLLPGFALQSGLAVFAYGIGRATDLVSLKDIAFPAGQVLTAWWSAVGRRLYHYGLPLDQVLRMQSRPEKLLLGGVTLWAGYKALQQISALSKRGAKDDAKYSTVKADDAFWNKSLLTLYLPEALFSTAIALPWTAPFRHTGAVLTGYHPIAQSIAVGLFSFGFSLELLADYQKANDANSPDSLWSVFTRPKTLGSIVSLLSFPILLYSSDMLAPIELLGPVAYSIFKRYQIGSGTTIEADVEKAKAEVKEAEEGKGEWVKKEAEEAKDEIVKIAKNKSFLSVLAVGLVFGLVEGFWHGPFTV
ncbi:hypothetical protein DV737_g3082, partial [Chaetothyriales sp. CBS 132003]